MLKRAGRILSAVTVALAFLLFCVWVVLESPWLSDWRISRIENRLGELIGQPIRIDGDIGAALYPKVIVYIKSATIPSQNHPDVDLAVLTEAELYLDAMQLLQGQFDIAGMKVENLEVFLVTLESGEKSWTNGHSEARSDSLPANGGQASNDIEADEIAAFLLSRSVDIKKVNVFVENRKTGFDFQFLLDEMQVVRLSGDRGTTVAGHGGVNGQPFSFQGEYPEVGPFRSEVILGDLSALYTGEFVDRAAGSYRGKLVVKTESLGNLLETLRLERSFGGRAGLNAILTREKGIVSASDLQVDVDLTGGQKLSVRGDIDDVLKVSDVRIKVDANFAQTGEPMEPARRVEDIRLVSLAADITSIGQAFSLDRLALETNFTDGEFRNIGPITARHLVRTEEGLLSLLGVRAQTGEPDAPFLTADGEIHDLLRLKSYEATGELNIPAAQIFEFLPAEAGDVFGSAHAEFALSDANGAPRLSHFNLRTEGSDYWALTAQASAGNIAEIENVTMKFDLDVADGVEFLKALNLDPIDTGQFGLSGEIQNSDNRLHLASVLNLGETRIDSWLNASRHGGRPVVRGAVESKEFAISDLNNAVAAGIELASLAHGKPQAATEDGTKVQPLVLPPAPDPGEQPLVLGQTEPRVSAEDPDNWVLQPLSLGAGAEVFELEDLLDVDRLLRTADLKIGIEVDDLVGQSGVSGISSDLEVSRGQLRFGPLKVQYGGGSFSIRAGMNLIEAPEIVHVSGATNGWDFGKILKDFGIAIQASGTLAANFDLSGNKSSLDAFLKTLNGSVYVGMRNGRIGTTLIDLAGLGVLPWLFSRERQKGYTDIVCVAAPITVRNGRMASQSVVIESDRVQLVVKGSANWRNDRIALRAEPRPIGKPFARSAWPFEVVGRLSEPQVRILDSAIPAKRSPLAVAGMRTPCKPDAAQLGER